MGNLLFITAQVRKRAVEDCQMQLLMTSEYDLRISTHWYVFSTCSRKRRCPLSNGVFSILIWSSTLSGKGQCTASQSGPERSKHVVHIDNRSKYPVDSTVPWKIHENKVIIPLAAIASAASLAFFSGGAYNG